MCSSSAARFCTPPAASSVDSISRFSKSVITSLNEMPSGGTTNCGMWKLGALPHVIGNQLDADPRSRGQHHRPLDDVLELADVARPVVLGQQVERLGRQLEAGLAVLLAVLLQEMLHEQRDVVLALAQRRQLDR